MKNWQRTINTEEKLDVIGQLENGERMVDICHNVRLAHISICTDKADRNKECVKCYITLNVNNLK